MDKRKVIQITTGKEGGLLRLFALCNDGSLWWCDFDDEKWYEMELPPATEEEGDQCFNRQ